MASVAERVDLPIKIELPLLKQTDPMKPCVLLGLGDMIIPGLFISFLRRFDKNNFISAYFPCGIASYALALTICSIMLWVFQVAQPALLYISPGLLIPSIYLAYHRNEHNELWTGIEVGLGDWDEHLLTQARGQMSTT